MKRFLIGLTLAGVVGFGTLFGAATGNPNLFAQENPVIQMAGGEDYSNNGGG